MGTATIGIDCGTQGLKALVLDVEEARILAQARRPLALIEGLPPGAMEQDPRTWWEALDACVREVATELGARRADVRAIAVSGQQHGFVPLDAEGEVLRPAKLWCDTHTAAEATWLLERLGGLARALELLGNGVPVGFTASKILWLARHEPERFARLATVLLPHDWLNFRLTGRRATEAGDASGTALFDVRRRAFEPRACAAIAGDLAERLPPVVAPDEPLGTLRPDLARAWGLSPEVLVAPGGGDNMMGAIGTGNVRAGIVTCSLGTSGTLYAYADRPIVDPRGEVAAFCDSTGAWLPLICTLQCTTAIEAVRTALGLSLAEFEQCATRAPAGCDGLLFHPTFEGERTPDLPTATGSWFGLRPATLRRETLARSAYEGATLALGHGLARLRELGVEPQAIRLTGGGARSPLWRAIAADVFGVPCEGLASQEGAALGAALQAAWIAGADRSRRALEELCDHVVRPDERAIDEPRSAAVARYAQLAEHYRAVQDALRERYDAHRHLLHEVHAGSSREQHP